MLHETINNLNVKEDLIYVDCTLGYTGHSREILKKIKKGFLFAFDQDIEAVNYSQKELNSISDCFEIIKSNFVNLKEELNKRGINKVDGILFDLGVSSPQLDDEKRGFSYHKDARLDMRMDVDSNLSAYEVVNNYSYEQLVDIFFNYGEEKYAKSIAKKIITYRQTKPIETTLELVDLIIQAVPSKYRRKTHPARRIFQAIRIEVNDELKIFEKALEQAIELLNPRGRLCVITFHSLEDKICKRIFKKYSDIPLSLKKLPSIPEAYRPKLKIIGKFKPTKEEIKINNRARSATLRVAERL